MAFVPVPNCVEADIRMLLDGQQIENTLYFVFPGGFDGSAMTTLGIDLMNWWDTQLSQPLSNVLQLSEIYLTDLRAEDGLSATVVPADPIVGKNSSGAMPNNVTICISFRTQSRGRSGRGRNYVPGLCENNVFNSRVDATPLAAIVAAYNALPGIVSADGWEWVVVSRYHNNAPRAEGVTQNVTAAIAVDNVVDSQRRRLPGRGS